MRTNQPILVIKSSNSKWSIMSDSEHIFFSNLQLKADRIVTIMNYFK